MNASNIEHFPTWYIFNDALIVLFNLINIFTGTTFVSFVIRRKKLRTAINILSSNSCVCGSLLAIAIIWDAFYMLKSDLSGLAKQDRSCVIRNICMLTALIALNYSFCLQTYHRFMLIVHHQRTSFRSKNLYRILILIQWLISSIVLLPVIFSQKILYQSGSFICQISFSNTSLSIYLFLISYGIPLVFIIILHTYIIYHIKNSWKFHQQQRLYILCPLQTMAIIILVLIVSYIPYGIFFLCEHLQLSVVLYAHRIALIFASFSFSLTMILIFGLNRSIRKSCLLVFR